MSENKEDNLSDEDKKLSRTELKEIMRQIAHQTSFEIIYPVLALGGEPTDILQILATVNLAVICHTVKPEMIYNFIDEFSRQLKENFPLFHAQFEQLRKEKEELKLKQKEPTPVALTKDGKALDFTSYLMAAQPAGRA